MLLASQRRRRVTSVVRWNLRPVICGVNFRMLEKGVEFKGGGLHGSLTLVAVLQGPSPSFYLPYKIQDVVLTVAVA